MCRTVRRTPRRDRCGVTRSHTATPPQQGSSRLSSPGSRPPIIWSRFPATRAAPRPTSAMANASRLAAPTPLPPSNESCSRPAESRSAPGRLRSCSRSFDNVPPALATSRPCRWGPTGALAASSVAAVGLLEGMSRVTTSPERSTDAATGWGCGARVVGSGALACARPRMTLDGRCTD